MLRKLHLSLCVIFLLGIASQVQACSCVRKNGTPEYYYSRATQVFVARVVATREIAQRGDQSKRAGVAATFTLGEVLKGNPRHLRTIESGYGNGDCGVPLLVGSTYVFFTGPDREVNICNGTHAHVAGYAPHDELLQKLRALNTSAR